MTGTNSSSVKGLQGRRDEERGEEKREGECVCMCAERERKGEKEKRESEKGERERERGRGEENTCFDELDFAQWKSMLWMHRPWMDPQPTKRTRPFRVVTADPRFANEGAFPMSVLRTWGS